MIANLLLVAVTLLVAWATKMLKNMQSRKVVAVNVEENATTDKRITELLQYLRLHLDAQRTYLSRFHNGDYFVDSSTVLKKTRTHETVREGMAYQAEVMKGILISTMADEMKLVMSPGPSFTRVHELPAGKFKWVCLEGGAHAVARCAVRKGGQIVGFIGVDFDHEDKPDGLDVIVEIAGRIEGLL